MIWTTKKGEEIPVVEMTTQHLKNAIAYMDRHPRFRSARGEEMYKALSEELMCRAYQKKFDDEWKEHRARIVDVKHGMGKTGKLIDDSFTDQNGRSYRVYRGGPGSIHIDLTADAVNDVVNFNQGSHEDN
jgi:hypothetical protein